MTGGGIWSKKIQFYVGGEGLWNILLDFRGEIWGDFRKYVDKIYSETLVGKTRGKCPIEKH